jgi:catalase
LLFGEAKTLLDKSGISATLSSDGHDPGLLLFDDERIDKGLTAFVKALTKHRHFERESDPPRI